MPSVNPVGSEILVNQVTAGTQSDPAAALLTNGTYALAWTGPEPSIGLRILDANGVPIGGDIAVTTNTNANANNPSLIALAGGGFVVGWNEGSDIRAQVFSNDGTEIGSEFVMNLTTTGSQSFQDIAALADGGFIATWISFNPSDPPGGVMAQRFAADGSRIGPEFQVDPVGSGGSFPSVAALTGGGFAVAWHGSNAPSAQNIYAQVFDSAGQKVGSPIPIDFDADGYHVDPAIAALPNDGFVVTWKNYSDPGSPSNLTTIFAQAFNAGGVPASGVFQVNDQPTVFNPQGLTVQGFWDGRFLIIWPDFSGATGDTDEDAVVGQLFDQTGAALSSEFRINTQTVNGQFDGTITALSRFTFLVGWTDQGPTLGVDVKAQLLALDNRIEGTAGPDSLVGDGRSNELVSLGGGDSLSGLAGDDFLLGGTGADTLDGGADTDIADYSAEYGAVRVNLLAGTGLWNAAHGDTLTSVEQVYGTAYDDLLFGDLGDNRLAGNNGADGLFGRAGNDLLEGGNGNDILDAEAGNDVLDGGNGNDVLDGGTGADILDGGIDVDTADYSDEYGAVFIHMPTGRGLWNSAHGDTLSGIDKVIGTNFDDHFWSDNVTNCFTGGGGNDTFVFNARFYQDVITDFAGNGAAAGDTVRFAAGLFDDFADMMTHATQQGSDVAIALDAANVLFLQSVQLADLHSSDFIYG